VSDGKPQPRAVVLGGGLAGLSAALRLAERRWAVTLVETRKVLGGRATSFNDPATGKPIDNCQHVLLGCCTNLLDLYRRLGVSDCIRWDDRLHFLDKHGHEDVLASMDMPAPLHLSWSMMWFKTLNWADKMAISRAMLAIMRMGKAGRGACADMTFGQWLEKHKQTRRAIDRFWSVIVVSACNLPPEKVGADHALQVFQEGFLSHPRAYWMGTSTVPLVQLYEKAGRMIEEQGGRVMTGCSVRAIGFDGEQVTGVTVGDGDTLTGDCYISALPFDRLAKVSPAELIDADSRLGGLGQIAVSPILGVHLWFDRPVTRRPHLIMVDSPLQWVFNKGTRNWELGAGSLELGTRNSERGTGDLELRTNNREAGTGIPATPLRSVAACDLSGADLRSAIGDPRSTQYLHAVVSAADRWVGRSAEQVIGMALSELSAYEPAVRDATLVRGRVIKEKRATFAAVPGFNAYRATTTGSVSNLLLAGDWCATGWPSTMEGAVRSGYAAAGAAMGRNLLIDDLPASSLYCWFNDDR
jgi:squalene-associated FAD-dependent desaturase